MIISVNWLKKFTSIDCSIEELTDLIGSRLVEIEEVVDLGEKYKDVRIAKVVECEDLEGSDHLHVTKIDDGGVVDGVERDENGHVQVVCGAPNVVAGMTVAWLPPRATVPSSFSDDEPFVLDSRKLRGTMSHGMLASATELDLYDDHAGILAVDDECEAGASFAEIYELNDYLLDIENKSLTHRPDCFGVIGFAREVAAIQGKHFTTPDWLTQLDAEMSGRVKVEAPLANIEDSSLCARYQAVILEADTIGGQSPLHIQTYLARAGMRPINAVVDVTNYLMLLVGQPLHAFDYDKVKKVAGSELPTINVREARDGEPLTLLDGRTVTLDPSDIVIAADDTVIGLAGAMGGADTEIDNETKTIILESATFDMFRLRTTQMRHGIFSEAITRFTKGQPAQQTTPVLHMAVELMKQWARVSPISGVTDVYPEPFAQPTVTLSRELVNNVLGTNDTLLQMTATLENVEFDVSVNEGEVMVVQPPYWRHDIAIAEDIIEEIGRINAYDDIEPTLATRSFVAVRPSDFDTFKARIRAILERGGANEVLTYSFVHGDLLKKANQIPENSYRIINSISPDLQYYRQSLTPSLLGLVSLNVRSGYESFGLFEINKVHSKLYEQDGDVPFEKAQLAYVATQKAARSAMYYDVKHVLDFIAEEVGISLVYVPLEEPSKDAIEAPYEYRRSARILDASSQQYLGIIGEYKKAVTKQWKLPEFTAGFEIDVRALLQATERTTNTQYTPLTKYPGTTRDVCFKVDEGVRYSEVLQSFEENIEKSSLPGLRTSIEPVDIYHKEGEATKNVTLRIHLVSSERTLASDEVNSFVEMLGDTVVKNHDAVIV